MRATVSIRILFLALLACLFSAESLAGVFVSITVAPPILPVYVQPVCPGDGYLWTPGYWAYGAMGYYWVPGVWVRPPQVGFLWTPGYWGWGSGVYAFHAGYWGPHVGFYGGVNYGFGFTGVGFQGGYWSGGHFAYNSAVNNVNTTIIHNTYNRTVISNTVVHNRVSFNGGPGGINARPGPQEQAAMREQHFQPTANQLSHEQAAGANRAQWASVNHGRPTMTAMGRPMLPPNSVNNRRVDQQNRIANGVRSGQLTPGETARVEHHEQQINRQISQDRRANGGSLTPAERQNINRQQNAASRQINRDKHNANPAPR